MLEILIFAYYKHVYIYKAAASFFRILSLQYKKYILYKGQPNYTQVMGDFIPPTQRH
jgi:hypothetical protein